MSLDEVFRFRCEGELKERFDKIAAAKRRDPSDLARIVFEDYVRDEERVLKEDAKPAPMPPAQKVSYRNRKGEKKQRMSTNKKN